MDKTSAVIVADAGPIIHLDELGCLDVLTDFGKVLAPQTVWQKVERHRPLALLQTNDWRVCQSPSRNSALVSALTPLYSLHSGEQEALHLCVELGNALLLTDRRHRRAIGRQKFKYCRARHIRCVDSSHA